MEEIRGKMDFLEIITKYRIPAINGVVGLFF